MSELTNWKTLFKKEAWGEPNFGLEIRVSLDHSIEDSKEARLAVYRIADQLEDVLLRDRERNDPQQQLERDAQKKHFLACFPEGMAIFAEPIPNGYCSRWCCEMSPWYKVTTPKGIVTLGWRKRVIEISWEQRVNDAFGERLFPDEDVTKSGRMIHAWGYDKAKQYLALILGA